MRKDDSPKVACNSRATKLLVNTLLELKDDLLPDLLMLRVVDGGQCVDYMGNY